MPGLPECWRISVSEKPERKITESIKEVIWFYCICIKETLLHALGVSDIFSSVFAMVVPLLVWYFHTGEATVSGLYWKIPVASFAVFGFIRLFLSPFFVWRECRDKLKQFDPKFEISECVIQHSPLTDPTTGAHNADALFVQIQPRCLTKSPVPNCRAYLVRVFKKNNEKWISTGIDESDLLTWSQMDGVSCTLEPGAERRISLCGSRSDFPSTLLPLTEHRMPARAGDNMGIPGIFSFDVQVSANDCAPILFSVVVQFKNDQWDGMICTLHDTPTADRPDFR